MALSIYQLKPAFIQLLRPAAQRLVAAGACANHVTAVACLFSCALGIALALFPAFAALWCFLPVWLFLRMALNAIDGIMARECNQKSRLGALFNEMGDAIADAALIASFAAVSGIGGAAVAVFLWLALLTEFAGAIGLLIGASRRYDGPMGKSDRAFAMGVAAFCVAASIAWEWPLLCWVTSGFWLCSFLMLLTTYNRLRGALSEGGASE